MAGHVLDERFEKYSFGTIRSYRKIISDLQLFKVIFTCIPDKFKEDLGPWKPEAKVASTRISEPGCEKLKRSINPQSSKLQTKRLTILLCITIRYVESNKKNAIDSLEVNSLFSFTNMAESWCVKTALTCYFFCSDLEKQKIVQPNTRHQLCDCSHQVALLNDFFLEKMHMTEKETPATCTNKCVYFHGSVIFWTGNTTSSEPTCPLSLSLRCE